VTPRRARCRRQNQGDNTQRPRSRREALGPLSAIGGKSPRAALPNTHQPGQTLCDDAPITATPSQTDGCAASGYRVRCLNRAFEFPILDPPLRRHRRGTALGAAMAQHHRPRLRRRHGRLLRPVAARRTAKTQPHPPATGGLAGGEDGEARAEKAQRVRERHWRITRAGCDNA